MVAEVTGEEILIDSPQLENVVTPEPDAETAVSFTGRAAPEAAITKVSVAFTVVLVAAVVHFRT